jgi:Domain of unknown function (DUF892)
LATAEKNLNDLFLDTLKDIYFAECQILKNLPKMAKAANGGAEEGVPDAPRPDGAACRAASGDVELIGRRAQAKTCEGH